jgi:rRNA maturation protein Nop10
MRLKNGRMRMRKCKKCGTEVLPEDPCPTCGEMPGAAETITDIPRTDFKAARKKLREEMAEGIEEDKKRM